MGLLGDLPGLNKKADGGGYGQFNDNTEYNFEDFDDIDGSGKSRKSSNHGDKYSNAMKQLDDFDND